MSKQKKLSSIEVEKKHAKYSASSAHRWLNCAASIRLSELAPPQEESKYALEGTNAHACLEEVLGRKIDMHSILKRYGEEKFSHAIEAARVIEKTLITDLGANNSNELLIERKGKFLAIHPEFGGTVDASVVELFGTLYVFDYKYGVGLVEAESNEQMISYALMIAEDYDWNFTDVVMTIIQPRGIHPNGPVRSWRISIHELEKYVKVFKEGVKRCENPKAEPVAGDWCKYCPAKLICPALTKGALKKAQLDFDDLPDPTDIKKLGAALKALEKIELWGKAVREFAESKLARGEKIDGYKLAPKRATRKWYDANKATDFFEDLLGIDAFNCELKSPSQMKKAVRDRFKSRKYWFDVDAKSTPVSSGHKLVNADYNVDDEFTDD